MKWLFPVPDGPQTQSASERSIHSSVRSACWVVLGITVLLSSHASNVLPVGSPEALRRVAVVALHPDAPERRDEAPDEREDPKDNPLDAPDASSELAAYDELDITSVQHPAEDYVAAMKQPVAGFRLGLPPAFFDHLDPEVARVTAEAIEMLRDEMAPHVD